MVILIYGGFLDSFPLSILGAEYTYKKPDISIHLKFLPMASPQQGPLAAKDIASLRDGIIVIGCQYLFWGTLLILRHLILCSATTKPLALFG